MVRFERSRDRNYKDDFKDNSSRRDGPPKRDNFRGSSSRRDGPPKRDNFRGSSSRGDRGRSDFDDSYGDNKRGSFNRGGRDRRDSNMTKVTCSSCGNECEVPFVPTSNKPIYCNACFSGKDKPSGPSRSSNSPSNRDLDVINEKLNKIMKALKIE